ncbi:MAG: rhodanese-like domain-containing protein [Actinomycetales bacterium]|nr:rhodanese-like domain-containing protein [Actinomycetales bacterium]
MTSSDSTPSLLDRLKRLVGGGGDDGRLPGSVDATRGIELVRDGAALVDVRERQEWKRGHAPQAVHVPLAEVSEKAPRRLSKDRPVVVVCASGMRSRSGAKQLRALGFDATSVSGGMAAWQRAGGSVR